jgi:helicase
MNDQTVSTESAVLIRTADFHYANWDFEHFNPVQSELFKYYDKDTNGIVAASTSAGKTVCAEMFLSYDIRKNKKKGIILFPIKALAQEKYDDWTDPKHHFSDLKIKIMTGDYRTDNSDDNFDILIMTSEMLNSKTRLDKDNFMKKIGTLVIDESHMIASPGRGDHLEVGLMNFIKCNSSSRIILLSATMPNIDDISEWLKKISDKECFVLKSSYRPCPLKIHYEPYDDSISGYTNIENEKINKCIDIVEHYPKDKFLIFVHTKKTGEHLKKELIEAGIDTEFHNANLEKSKRIELENKFKNDPEFRVIVATSTLACGLNLPSRRVIVAGIHRGLSLVESSNIMQMCGRAGRPRYDKKGDAYILLPESQIDSLKKDICKVEKINSQLLVCENGQYKVLSFHLVNEIYNSNILNANDVHDWYEKTLCCSQSKDIDSLILDSTINNLKNKNIIIEKDNKLKTTNVGKISSIFYYSPFDVADFKNNLKLYYKYDIESDYFLSFILANIDTHRCGVVSKNEKTKIDLYKKKLEDILSHNRIKCFYNDSALKVGYCYYMILNGLHDSDLSSTCRTLQMDFPRTLEVLKSINSFDLKMFENSFFEKLRIRIQNGVPPHLVELCQIPNIGKQRSKKLYDNNIKNITDVLNAPLDKLQNILNLKSDIVNSILKDARELLVNCA